MMEGRLKNKNIQFTSFQLREELLKAVSSPHHGSSAAVTVLKEDFIS